MTNTVDIVRLPGDYKIVTNPGGNLTIDVGYSSVTTGTVHIKGNLIVEGVQTSVETKDTVIKDKEIVLNEGGGVSGYIGGPSGGQAGIKIDRGGNNYDARFVFDDSLATGSWNDFSQSYRGLWRFQAGNHATMINVAGIKLDSSGIANTLNVDNNPRLILIGDDPLNHNAVISVKGTVDYELNVNDDDDIPNKKYVDTLLGNIGVNTATYAQMLVNNNGGIEAPVPVSIDGSPLSWISISRVAGNGTGRISMFIDDYLTMDIGPESVQLAELSVAGSSIQPFHTGTNIYLVTDHGAEVVVNSAVTYQVPDAPPSNSPGQVKVYSTGTAGAGGTGLLFANEHSRDELVSAKRALIYSIIF